MVERFSYSWQLASSQAWEHERGINDVLVNSRYLVSSFHVTLRATPEIFGAICSYLTTEEDVFLASQVCYHWRATLISFAVATRPERPPVLSDTYTYQFS